MRRMLVVVSLVMFGAVGMGAPLSAAPLSVGTFMWFCDVGCDFQIDPALGGVSIGVDVMNIPLDGTAVAFTDAMIRAEVLTGGGYGNSFLGSQSPATAEAVEEVLYDPVGLSLQILLDSVQSFYFGGAGIELTASGSTITTWALNPLGAPEDKALGHFQFCENTTVGSCANFVGSVASVPEPATLLLVGTGIGAVFTRRVRGRWKAIHR